MNSRWVYSQACCIRYCLFQTVAQFCILGSNHFKFIPVKVNLLKSSRFCTTRPCPLLPFDGEGTHGVSVSVLFTAASVVNLFLMDC